MLFAILVVGASAACRALNAPRSSMYRARKPKQAPSSRATPARGLKPEEKAAVRTVLNREQSGDCALREVCATLLDEGTVYCHWQTMYQILAEHDEVRERRNQRCHPASSRPESRATGQNQLWSWDISRLRGPQGICYYLHTAIDVFSRYLVGWMIALRESADLAQALIAETCAKQGLSRFS